MGIEDFFPFQVVTLGFEFNAIPFSIDSGMYWVANFLTF